jgi:3-methylcrotonyl-CoA carboxylase alpha subunit
VSNQPFLKRVIQHKKFIEGSVDTGFVEEHSEELLKIDTSPSDDFIIIAATVILQKRIRVDNKKLIFAGPSDPWIATNGWRLNSENIHRINIFDDNGDYDILLSRSDDLYEVIEPFPGKKTQLTVDWRTESYCTVNQNWNDQIVKMNVFFDENIATFFSSDGARQISWRDRFDIKGNVIDAENNLKAPMPGKIISIEKTKGDKIRQGETLLVLEAMKMQHSILAPSDGIVKEMYFAAGEVVSEGDQLLDFESDIGG